MIEVLMKGRLQLFPEAFRAHKMFDGWIALPYGALNFPIHLHLVDEVGRHRIHVKHRPSSAAPLLLRMEDNDGSGDDDESITRSRSPQALPFPPQEGRCEAPLLASPDTVGVLGGLSAASTLGFLDKLVRWGPERGLPFVVCNDPAPAKGGSTPDVRSIAVESLRRRRVFLERSGARCIAMPCRVAQAWHEEVAEGCSVLFLDAGECVAEELKAADLKPVEMGSNVRVGVLAVDAPEVGRFYQGKLEGQGFEVLLPDKATMEHIVIPAKEAFDRKDMEGARNLLRIAIQVLLVRAVCIIVLASDYMNGLLPEDDPLLRKCIDPMDALKRIVHTKYPKGFDIHTSVEAFQEL